MKQNDFWGNPMDYSWQQKNKNKNYSGYNTITEDSISVAIHGKCIECGDESFWMFDHSEFYCHNCFEKKFFSLINNMSKYSLAYTGYKSYERLAKLEKKTKNTNCKICKIEKAELKKTAKKAEEHLAKIISEHKKFKRRNTILEKKLARKIEMETPCENSVKLVI
jgi:hypothetical protein